jgi:hypothetical protein
MFGCSALNFLISSCISGISPTQEAKEMVTGAVGSGTGPSPSPWSVDESPPVEQPTSASTTAVATALRARDLRDKRYFIGSAPSVVTGR